MQEALKMTENSVTVCTTSSLNQIESSSSDLFDDTDTEPDVPPISSDDCIPPSFLPLWLSSDGEMDRYDTINETVYRTPLLRHCSWASGRYGYIIIGDNLDQTVKPK